MEKLPRKTRQVNLLLFQDQVEDLDKLVEHFNYPNRSRLVRLIIDKILETNKEVLKEQGG